MRHTQTHMNARAKGRLSALVVACFVLALVRGPIALLPTVEAASSFGPTLLVNTEAFLVIDDADTTADVVMRFGDTLAKTLTFNRLLDRFDFNDDVHTSGTFSASGTLVTESGAYIDGTSLVVQANSNNVGIGTASPSADLHVVGSETRLDTGTTDGTTSLSFVDNNDEKAHLLLNQATQTFDIQSDGRLSVTSSDYVNLSGSNYTNIQGSTTFIGNNVGIGTTGPKTRLDVVGAISGSFLYATRSFSGAGLSDCDTAGTSKLLWDASTGRFSCGTDQGTTYTAGQGLSLNGTSFRVNDTLTGSLARFATVSGSNVYAKNALAVGTTHSGALLTVGRVGSGSTFKTATNSTLFSVDQMALAQLQGGAVFGRTTVTENQWQLSNTGKNWSPRGATQDWIDIAMSSNGRYQTAVNENSQIYISSDTGNTWSGVESTRIWQGVAMSSDGKYQTALDGSPGKIYVSSDYGLNWAPKESDRSWSKVAMSADGKYQTATIAGGNIYRSIDYGSTWTAHESSRMWNGVAMSSDGKIQTAIADRTYVSSDYGKTWTAKGSALTLIDIAMSADGRVQTAVGQSGVYVSYDYGQSWSQKLNSGNPAYGVAMSADGRIQTVVENGNERYHSTNYGLTWTLIAGESNWSAVAMSSDGKVQTITEYGGTLHQSTADSFQYGSVAIGTGSVKGNTKLMVQGILSGVTLYATKSFSGAGLSDCDSGTSKLLWDATTGRFSCGTVTSTAYTAGQGLSLNGTSFRLNATVTGSVIQAANSLASSGSLSWKGIASGATLYAGGGEILMNQAGISINPSALSEGTGKYTNIGVDSLQVRDGIDTNPTSFFLNPSGGNVGVGRSTSVSPKATLDVVGSISGSLVSQNGAGNNSFMGNVGVGSTTAKAKLTVNGVMSGVTLYATKSFSGAGLTDCDGGTSKLLWDATTGRFSCGTVSGSTYTAGQGLTLAGTAFSLSQSISGTLLEFQTVSGSTVYGSKSVRSSGALVWEGAGSGSSLDLAGGNITSSRSGATFFNTGLKNVDFGVFGRTNNSLFYIDASGSGTTATASGGIGIGTRTPTTQLHVAGRMPTIHQGSWSMGTGPYDVEVQGKILYSIDGSGNLKTADVSNASSPVTLGSLTGMGSPTDIAVQGSYAYVTTGLVVKIVDISNPKSPTLVATTPSFGGATYYVAVSGPYLYVTDASGTLSTVDVSNPTAATITSTLTAGGKLSTDGGFLYAADAGTLRIFNLRNPAAPFQQGTLSVTNASHAVGQGRYVYVARYDSSALSVVDASDPANPVAVGTVTVASPRHIAVAGRRVFVADLFSKFSVIDVTNPVAPTLIGSVNSGGSTAVGVAASGRYAYVANRDSSTITIFDMGGAYAEHFEAGTAEMAALTVRQEVEANDATIKGGLSAGRLFVFGNAAMSGALKIAQGLSAGSGNIVFSRSGSAVFNEQSRNVDLRVETDNDPNAFMVDASADRIGIGTVAPKAKLDVVGTISGAFIYATRSFSGAGLTDCDTGATSKLLWDASTGRFSCGTDQTGGTGGSNWSNTGSLQLAFDSRYVNTHGDTMTGKLLLQNTMLDVTGSGRFVAYDAGDVVLTVKGDSMQTGDLQRWTNSSDGVLVNIGADGNIGAGNATFNGNVNITGSNTALGDSDTDNVSINGDVVTNINPEYGGMQYLGNSSNRWVGFFHDANVSYNLSVDGNVSAYGSVFLGNDNSDYVYFGGDVNSSFNADANNTYDIGNTSNRWATGWFSNMNVSETGYFGGNVSVGGVLTLGSSDGNIYNHATPYGDLTFDLGSVANRWRKAYLGSANVYGVLSGVTLYATKSFSGAGLTDCDTGATSKLLWDATTGRFSCGTDQTGGGTGSAWSNTGSLQLAFDSRYVNTSGDTMTGALNIQSGNAAAATLANLLSVRGTMSGKSLTVMGTGSTALLATDTGSPAVRVGGSGMLLLGTRNAPSTVPANTAGLYAQKLAGRPMLHQASGSTIAASALQPGLFGNLIMSISTGAGTTVNGYGTTVTNDTTVSHPATDQTFGYMTNFATSTTTNDEAGTSSTTTSFFRGSTAGANGFFYYARVGVVDTTSITVFSGMADQTIATMVGADNPAGNHVGFQFSTGRGDTNWMFTTRDGSTQTASSTGLAFTANKVYDLLFTCTKQCTSITWEIRNVTDGTSATGVTSSNLPTAGTALRIVLGVETETTAAKNIRMQQIYVEADR